MIIYLTYNEQPSGIFSSQVVDVVRFIDSELKAKIKLVSFISIRDFFSNKKKIKAEWPAACVLPMVPGIKRWRWNSALLKWILMVNRPKVIICRSVLATNLALNTSANKIVYDGRGAITEEWTEYNVINDPVLQNEIGSLERNAVINSDLRIAVSTKLLEHWKKKFHYHGNEHVIIPCTLNKDFEQFKLDKDSLTRIRESLGIENYEVAFVYSGSLAGWQSFDLLYDFLKEILKVKDHKIIFYSDNEPSIEKLEKEFGNKVIRRKISPREMPEYLAAGDHGLLIREKSVTNSVASPVKFAEYLRSGLNIIISEGIGDYTEMVMNNGWGQLYTDKDLKLKRPSIDEKLNISLKARELFGKKNYVAEYKEVIRH